MLAETRGHFQHKRVVLRKKMPAASLFSCKWGLGPPMHVNWLSKLFIIDQHPVWYKGGGSTIFDCHWIAIAYCKAYVFTDVFAKYAAYFSVAEVFEYWRTDCKPAVDAAQAWGVRGYIGFKTQWQVLVAPFPALNPSDK